MSNGPYKTMTHSPLFDFMAFGHSCLVLLWEFVCYCTVMNQSGCSEMTNVLGGKRMVSILFVSVQQIQITQIIAPN